MQKGSTPWRSSHSSDSAEALSGALTSSQLSRKRRKDTTFATGQQHDEQSSSTDLVTSLRTEDKKQEDFATLSSLPDECIERVCEFGGAELVIHSVTKGNDIWMYMPLRLKLEVILNQLQSLKRDNDEATVKIRLRRSWDANPIARVINEERLTDLARCLHSCINRAGVRLNDITEAKLLAITRACRHKHRARNDGSAGLRNFARVWRDVIQRGSTDLRSTQMHAPIIVAIAAAMLAWIFAPQNMGFGAYLPSLMETWQQMWTLCGDQWREQQAHADDD